MISREFVIEKHEEYGELGMRLAGNDKFDPLSGMAVAHDMLEHFPNDHGTVEEEFKALGASILVRNESRYYHEKGRIHKWPEQLAGDVADQFRYAVQRGNGFVFREPPKAKKLPDHVEDGINAMILSARRLLAYESSNCDEEYSSELNWYLNEAQAQRLRGWFRIGYRRAAKRYRNRLENAYHCFNLIEQKADQAINHAEFEGQRVRITVNVLRISVCVTELYEG